MLYPNLGEGRCPTVPDEWLAAGKFILAPTLCGACTISVRGSELWENQAQEENLRPVF